MLGYAVDCSQELAHRRDLRDPQALPRAAETEKGAQSIRQQPSQFATRRWRCVRRAISPVPLQRAARQPAWKVLSCRGMSPHVQRATVLALRSIGLIGYAICAVATSAVAGELSQPEMLLFDEPVVTAASKRVQGVHEAPSSVTIITREEIHRFGYRTLAEALRSVRGFYGRYDRNYDYIGVRGFLRAGDYNDRILLLVNGHTYNDDIYGSANLGYEFGIDMEAIERIEVIRGPGSALYGGNAVFAVLNVITSTGAELPGVRPLVETGSLGRKRGQLSVGHTFDDGLDVFASGSVLDVDGNSSLFYPEYDTPENHGGVTRDADAERAVNFFVSARYQNFSFQGGANSREKHIPTGAFDTTFDDVGTKTIDGRQFGEIAYTKDVLADLLFTGRAYYDGERYHGTYIYGRGTDRTKNEDFGTSHWAGSELRAQWTRWRGHIITGGAEYVYHPSVEQKNFNLPGASLLDDRRSFTNWGIYAEDEWRLARDFTLVGGLRFDSYYNSVQEVSPRLAAIWSPLSDTNVKLLFGRAFRPPNVYEQYYGAAAVGQVSNPHLGPERITTYEIVLEQALWKQLRAVVALYHYDIKGLIDQTTITDPTTNVSELQYQNLSSAHANGAEFEVQVPLPHGVNGRASYSIQEARAAGGTLLTDSPKHLGNVAVLFPLPLGVEAGAQLQLVGPRRTLAGSHTETEAVANLTLNYRAPLPGLSVSMGFYNIFNQHYSDPGGPEHVQDKIPQDGFTFRTQLQYAF
jgi:iron complex outermembrane receptor protein